MNSNSGDSTFIGLYSGRNMTTTTYNPMGSVYGNNVGLGSSTLDGASGNMNVGIGTGATASGTNSISIGTGNIVTGNNSGAIGDPTTISGNASYSLGNDNSIPTDNTFVVGNNVIATADNSVFLGDNTAYVAQGSTTEGLSTTYTSSTIGSRTYSYAGGDTNTGVVSVGSESGTRRIQNVSAGLVSATSTDAINGSQLYAVANTLGTEIDTLSNTVNNINTNFYGPLNRLDNKINKVGAGAAALSALHPLDFDPDEKWNFAAGYGNYNSANAMALGAFYRPNEDTMFSIGGSMGNGMLEGYPDGTFKGNQAMTRYEIAALFYRALKNGAPVDDTMDRAMNEFESEFRQLRLEHFRVDRISGKDNDRHKIERIRVNNEDNKEKGIYKDVYGSIIQK